MTEEYDSSYEAKLTGFLQQYLVIPKKGYTSEGYVSEYWARISLHFLLDACVFDSPQELQQDAYRDSGILIPSEMMEDPNEQTYHNHPL